MTVVYLAWFKKQNSEISTEDILSTQKETSQPVNWGNLLPAIKTAIGPTFLGEKTEKFSPMSIFDKKDITGDGVEEALIDLGSGGAHTSFLALVIIEKNKPVLAEFRQKDGEISPIMFLDGASVK